MQMRSDIFAPAHQEGEVVQLAGQLGVGGLQARLLCHQDLGHHACARSTSSARKTQLRWWVWHELIAELTWPSTEQAVIAPASL